MIGMRPPTDFDEALDHLRLLVRVEEGAFAGVAEHDQTLDAVDAAEPRAEALDGRIVDGAVAGEGGDGGGAQAAQVETGLLMGCLLS